MSDFGLRDPRDMPAHLFTGALHVYYRTAVPADVKRQNCSICPRYWYVDAAFACRRCGTEFTFSASEQQVWYEEYGFWIDSLPVHCRECRIRLRELKEARREYDRTVAEVLHAGDLAARKRLAAVIDQLYEIGGGLPPRIHENRRRLAHEISKAERALT